MLNSASTSEAGAPSLRRLLWTMCAALALVVSAVASLNVALPTLARELDATQTDLQWIVDAYAVVFAGLLLPAGAVGDRFGRKGTLLLGLAIFGAAYTAAVFATAPPALIAARAAAGVGAALIMPSTLSIITGTFPADQRERAVAVWAGVAGAGAIAGLLISGVVIELATWEWLFAANALWAAAAFAAALRVAPPSRDPARPALDPVGATLSGAALALLVLAIIEAPSRGWSDALVLTGVAASAALSVFFVAWERRRAQPLLDPLLFALRGFSAGTVALTLQFFALFGFFFVLLQYLQLVLGYSPLGAAVAMVPMGLFLISSARGLAPVVSGRYGMRASMVAGLTLMSGGLAWLALLDVDSNYAHLLAGIAALGLGAGLSTVPATSAIVNSLPAEKQGVASAVNDTAREVGGALGIAVLGSALAESYASALADATGSLPAAAGAAAQESLAAALAIADRLGQPALAEAARAAFVDGLAAAVLTAAGALLLAAAWVAVRAEHPTMKGASRDGRGRRGDQRPPHRHLQSGRAAGITTSSTLRRTRDRR